MSLRLLALALVASVGCSPALFSPVEREDPQVEEMKSRILELQRQARVSEVELERLRKQVAELEAHVAAATEPAPEPPRLDDGVAGIGEPASIESADIPPPPRPAAKRPLPADARETPVSVEPGPLPKEAQELYDRGYTLYHQGSHVDAESTFQQFLSAYGASELADNAHYWIGEARFARGDFSGARAAFRETVQRYPGGNKVPDALLRLADTLARLGDVDEARATYDEVLRRFPSSAAAPSASERRDELPGS